MAQRKRKKPVSNTPKRPSLLGSLLLEFVAIAGFILLMSNASSNRAESSLEVDGSNNQSTKYGSMIKGYFSDQIHRTGFVAK